MTDNEIVQALECCSTASCISKQCPYEKTHDIPKCTTKLTKDALDLINRQKAEIEQLNTVNAEMHESLRLASEANKDMQAEIGRMKNNVFCNVVIDEETMRNIINEKVAEFELDIDSIKAEAIKEFAERLKKEMGFGRYIQADQIDTLVKEVVGDKE